MKEILDPEVAIQSTEHEREERRPKKKNNHAEAQYAGDLERLSRIGTRQPTLRQREEKRQGDADRAAFARGGDPYRCALKALFASFRLRHRGICDGYENLGHRTGVIGHGLSGLGEALFLRTCSDDITLRTTSA